MTAALPGYIGVFWALSSFYSRTSRRLRIMDIESRAPLFANLAETMAGLTTIRAFGRQKDHRAIHHRQLCESQKPFYLLLAGQRWLTVVLDMTLAGFVVLLMGVGVGTMGQIPPSAMGLALVSTISLGSSFKMLITYWTGLEISLGAVSRVKLFVEETRSEHLSSESSVVLPGWTNQGSIQFINVTGYHS